MPATVAFEPTSETSESGISIELKTSCGAAPDISTAVTIALLAIVLDTAEPSAAAVGALAAVFVGCAWLEAVAPRLRVPSWLVYGLGLATGLALAQARAMHPGIDAVPEDAEADAALLESIADWCLRYTPLVACDAPDGLLLDISGCAHLFGGERELVADALVDAILWLRRQCRRLVEAVRTDFRLRAAEAQLHRMSDRELAVLEGDWDPARLVVLEFPDLEAAKRWYDSPQYQDAKRLREGAANLRMVAVQGLDEPL